jgi:hypothetical protein
MAEGSAFNLDPDPKKEALVSSETVKTRETTPEGFSGTRYTTTDKFRTPGGEVKKTPEGDKAYAALSQQQRDAQDARFKAKQREAVKSRFIFDPVKTTKKGIQTVTPKITGSMPEKVDTVIGGGDYKFDISGKKPVYSISQEVKQPFGGGVIGRYGKDESDVQPFINKSVYDKSTKTGAKNILKVTKTQGDFLPGMPESDKAQYLMNKEKAKEAKRLDKAYRSIGASNVTDEDRSNYKTAKQNILNKYKKLGSDIARSYRPISQGGGGEHRYTKRIKAISKPVYNSETGLNIFNKNK